MYKMIIVDDEPLIQMGLSSILDYTETDIEIVCTACTGPEAIDKINQYHPDLVMMDINIPILDGLQVMEQIQEQNTYPPLFIILSCHDEFGYAQKAVKLGALDYLLKIELTPEILKNTLKKAVCQLNQSRPVRFHDNPAQYREEITLVDNFFLKLLNNWFDSPNSILDMMEDLSIDLPGSFYSCALFSNPLAREEQPAVSPIYICNLITGLCKNWGQICHVIPWDFNSFALIFSFDIEKAQEPKFYQKTLLPCIHHIQDMVYRYQNVLYWIGAGRLVQSVDQICLSFNEAKAALRSCSALESISLFSGQKTGMGHPFNISILRDELTSSLNNYDVITLVRVLNQIPELIRNYITDPEQAIAMCSDIVHFIQVSYQGSQEITNDDFKARTAYYNLYKCRTPDQAAEWFQNYIDELCIQVKEDFESKKNWLLPGILKYIEEHYMEPISLTDVSSCFNVSCGYISTIFKKYNGIGFTECVTQVKIRHAKQLLLQPGARINEVASALGYSDPYYFSKVFKKQTGLSPKEYIGKKLIP